MPLLNVQNSRIVLLSPISSRVGSPGVLLVLGDLAQRDELEDPVVRADARVPGDDGVRADAAARADLDVRPDHGVRPDLDTFGESAPGCNDRGGMDQVIAPDRGAQRALGHGPQSVSSRPTVDSSIERMVHISSASAATASPTCAVPLNIQMSAHGA